MIRLDAIKRLRATMNKREEKRREEKRREEKRREEKRREEKRREEKRREEKREKRREEKRREEKRRERRVHFCPRPCSSTRRWARLATHRHSGPHSVCIPCSYAHFGRASTGAISMGSQMQQDKDTAEAPPHQGSDPSV